MGGHQLPEGNAQHRCREPPGSLGKKVSEMLANRVQLDPAVGDDNLPGAVEERGAEPHSKAERKTNGTLLVPLDGSSLSERVIPHAEALAVAFGFGIKLLRVVQPPMFFDPIGAGLSTTPAMWDAWAEEPDEAADYLEEIATRLSEREFPTDRQTMEGNPAACILGAVEDDASVAMIAMSTHGRSGLNRWVFGSVAEKVLQSSRVPLLLLRGKDDDKDIELTPTRYTRIVVPLDGSTFAEEALSLAEPLATAMDATLVLLTVAQTPFDATLVKPGALGGQTWVAAPWDEEAHYLTEYLDATALRLRAKGLNVETKVTYGDPSGEIMRVGNECEKCVVVMSTHGRGGLRGFFLGSVARKVSQSLTTPLLLVRVAT
jgi:nucleotide-binding universal stress UspA family protein